MYLFCKRPHNVTTQGREGPPLRECSFFNPRTHMTASVNSAGFVFSRSNVLWEIMLIWIQWVLSALGVFAGVLSLQVHGSHTSNPEVYFLFLFYFGLMKSSCADQNLDSCCCRRCCFQWLVHLQQAGATNQRNHLELSGLSKRPNPSFTRVLTKHRVSKVFVPKQVQKKTTVKHLGRASAVNSSWFR